ncbi:MAG TPA: hypothetical protein VGI72_09710 [Gaiellales bacterium]
MSTPEDADLLRSVTREVLADLLPGLLSEALTTNGNGHGDGARPQPGPGPASERPGPGPASPADAVPQVPGPPIAAVHRPSGWRPPAESDTTTAPAASAPAVSQDAGGATVERVDLRSDADLDAFVRSLVHRLENPRDRMAIRSGRLRFRLGATAVAGGGGAPAGAVIRVERGAVTERAVLTPMARDRARSLGVEIEKERPC